MENIYEIDSFAKVLGCLRILRTKSAYDRVDFPPEVPRRRFECTKDSFGRTSGSYAVQGTRFLNRSPTNVGSSTIESEYRSVAFAECGGAIDYMKLIWKS